MEDDGVYTTEENTKKKKYYTLVMFPYPSGEGLHVGHARVYIGADIHARMKRMQGYRVLHPMGWDAFGLPAEEYAIKHKQHPRESVEKNIATFKKQCKHLGLSYDWDREINTTDPAFYAWTQWIFLKLFKKGLAYESRAPVNWCPSCKTGLANEDLEQGRCERCGSAVERKSLRQWMLRITNYADRLLEDLDQLPAGLIQSKKCSGTGSAGVRDTPSPSLCSRPAISWTSSPPDRTPYMAAPSSPCHRRAVSLTHSCRTYKTGKRRRPTARRHLLPERGKRTESRPACNCRASTHDTRLPEKKFRYTSQTSCSAATAPAPYSVHRHMMSGILHSRNDTACR